MIELFLRSIEEDELAILAYSDYLEEQGRIEEAAYIRDIIGFSFEFSSEPNIETEAELYFPNFYPYEVGDGWSEYHFERVGHIGDGTELFYNSHR